MASTDFANENTGLDGYFETTASLAGFRRGPPYAFPDSQNALEDILGLIAALGVSKIPLAGPGVPADWENGNAVAVVQVTRLGTDRREALVLLIPLLGSLIILVCLFVFSFREDWKPGGGEKCRDRSGLPQPRRYAAESLSQLVSLRPRNCPSFEGPKSKPAVITIEGSCAL